MKLYLAGPMSGHPDFNYPKFNKVAKIHRARGLDIANPAEIDHGETEENRGKTKRHCDYIRAGMKLLLTCEGIMLMNGWHVSAGCLSEFYAAVACDMTVFFYDEDRDYLTSPVDTKKMFRG